ncbi:MAG: hypothetical protein AAFQ05_04720, partial [Pseudomonadota bacterium]
MIFYAFTSKKMLATWMLQQTHRPNPGRVDSPQNRQGVRGKVQQVIQHCFAPGLNINLRDHSW